MHKKTSAPLAPWPQHYYLSKPRGGGGGLGGFAYKDRARPPPPPPVLWRGEEKGRGCSLYSSGGVKSPRYQTTSPPIPFPFGGFGNFNEMSLKGCL